MSSPPKWMQAHQAQDEKDLKTRLRELADDWDSDVVYNEVTSTLRDCARQLREELGE